MTNAQPINALHELGAVGAAAEEKEGHPSPEERPPSNPACPGGWLGR